MRLTKLGNMNTSIAILSLLTWLACSPVGRNEASKALTKQSPLTTVQPIANPSPLATLQSPIRSVDFSNFTYPAKPIYHNGESTFTLRKGRYEGRPGIVGDSGPFGDPYPVFLVRVIYGDITNDGNEEAIVIISERVAGTAIPYYVYIFAMDGNHVKLPWAFPAGDRGDGGLRRVYPQGGALVVELYGKDTAVGDIQDKEENTPACCPKSFTRTRYEWNGKQFVQSGKPEVLLNPDNNADLLEN
jgi:hypothetical protein